MLNYKMSLCITIGTMVGTVETLHKVLGLLLKLDSLDYFGAEFALLVHVCTGSPCGEILHRTHSNIEMISPHKTLLKISQPLTCGTSPVDDGDVFPRLYDCAIRLLGNN